MQLPTFNRHVLSTILSASIFAGIGLTTVGCGSSEDVSESSYWKKYKKKKKQPSKKPTAPATPELGQVPAVSDPADLTMRDVPSDAIDGVIRSCHDGDTCYARLSTGESLTMRFAGIDAPEVSGGDDGRGQPMGTDARDVLNGLVKGKAVKIRQVERDMYNRMVSEVYVDGRLINLYMVESGYAEAYKWAPNKIDRDAYFAAEQRAKKDDKGVWTLDNYETPYEFRQKTKQNGGSM